MADLLSRMNGLSTNGAVKETGWGDEPDNSKETGWGPTDDDAIVADPPPAANETPASPTSPSQRRSSLNDPATTALLQSLHAEVQVTLADQQQDPNSPLYSAKSFEELNLHENLLKGIYKMGFQKPSKIQERALPLLLQNPPRNMIGQSQSGTGKTAAFALTMLSRIDFDDPSTQAICIAPARELAYQTLEVIQKMGQYTPVTTLFASKGTVPRGQRVEQHVVVGTAGTIMDLVQKRQLNPTKIKVFVLDEADNMLEEGSMADQCIQVKNMVSRANPEFQIVLFSATYPDHVRNFATRFAPDANLITLRVEELSLDAIKQFFLDCKSEEHKYEVLVELYNILTIGQSIIFVRRRDTADQIAERMTAEGHKVISLHGLNDASDRDARMNSFRNGSSKVLISTNVIARGIDVLQVNMVVNYDIPTLPNGDPDAETYIHRIGRTGRFGRQGISVNMIHDRRSYEQMCAIEQFLGKGMTRVDTEDPEAMEAILKAALKA